MADIPTGNVGQYIVALVGMLLIGNQILSPQARAILDRGPESGGSGFTGPRVEMGAKTPDELRDCGETSAGFN